MNVVGALHHFDFLHPIFGRTPASSDLQLGSALAEPMKNSKPTKADLHCIRQGIFNSCVKLKGNMLSSLIIFPNISWYSLAAKPARTFPWVPIPIRLQEQYCNTVLYQ